MWHVSSDPSSNSTVLCHSLRLVCATPAPHTLPRLPGMVKILEKWLYQIAPSREDYRDLSTLQVRLHRASVLISATIRATLRNMAATEAGRTSGGPRRQADVSQEIGSLTEISTKTLLARKRKLETMIGSLQWQTDVHQTIASPQRQASARCHRQAVLRRGRGRGRGAPVWQRVLPLKREQWLRQQQQQQQLLQRALRQPSEMLADHSHLWEAEYLLPLAREATVAAFGRRLEREEPSNGFELALENVRRSRPGPPDGNAPNVMQQRWETSSRRSEVSSVNIANFLANSGRGCDRGAIL